MMSVSGLEEDLVQVSGGEREKMEGSLLILALETWQTTG